MLKLDLQYFSEEVLSSGEEDLIAAIKSLKDSEEVDEINEDVVDEVDEDVVDDVPTDEDTDDEDDELEDEEDHEDVVEEPKKKVQSKEENAKFAAQRRQKELEDKVQAELQNSAEYKIAQRLSKMYGRPVEQIMEELETAQLAQEAEETGISVERLKKERESNERAERLEQEINQLKFENWQSKIKLDGESLKGQYPMLDETDIGEAVNYILYTARNVDMPLEQAVYALHGKKIIEAQVKNKMQDDLASQSGRAKKTPLTPSGRGKASVSDNLTNEEKYIAKQLGLSYTDYAKHK